MQQVGVDGWNGTGKPAEENPGKPKREADGLSAEPGSGTLLRADGLSAEPGGSPSRGRADTATADEQKRVKAAPPLQGNSGHERGRRQGLNCLSTTSRSRPPISCTSDGGAAGTVGPAPRKQRCSRIYHEPTSAPETRYVSSSSELPVSGVGECQRDADISLLEPYKKGTGTASIMCRLQRSQTGGRGQADKLRNPRTRGDSLIRCHVAQGKLLQKSGAAHTRESLALTTLADAIVCAS